MKLDLSDLKPAEAHFHLSGKGEKQYTLRKFSLASQIWMKERFGQDKIKTIFENQSIPEISELVYYQLKEPHGFHSLHEFQEEILEQKDRIAIMTALLKTIGISQPVVEKLAKDVAESQEGNVQAPNPTP
jgi:hypothetical protein